MWQQHMHVCAFTLIKAPNMCSFSFLSEHVWFWAYTLILQLMNWRMEKNKYLVIFHCFYHEVFICMEYGCMMNWWWWMHILVTISVQEKHAPIIGLMMYYCVRKLGACIVSFQHSFHVLWISAHIVDLMFVLFSCLVSYPSYDIRHFAF
jgi:hypothetical protein